MEQDYDKYSALACLKETEGEPGVMKALRKIYDKMQTLEQAKERRKQRVESLGKQIDHPSADEFCRRLAKAEAQCKLLEQQLSYVRKIVVQTHSEPQEAVPIPDTQNDTNFDQYHLHNIPTKLQKEKNISPLENYLPSMEEASSGTIGGFLNKAFAQKVNSFATSTSISLKNYPERDEAALFKQYNHEKPCGSKPQSQRSQIVQMSFVPATTSSKSHSLRANMQVFHSMVKYCNPVLCSAASLHRQRSLSAERHSQIRDSRCSRRMRSNSTSDLSNLIALTRTDEKQRGRSRRSRSNERFPVNFDQQQSTNGWNAHESNSVLKSKKITNAQKKLILRNLQQVNEILKHCAST